MDAKIKKQKQNKAINEVLAELKIIKEQLSKLLLLIPLESLKEYKNANQIKKDYLESLSDFPPA